MPINKKLAMPCFNIVDAPKRHHFVIQWYDDNQHAQRIYRNYNKRSKEEALALITNDRYEVVMKWLEAKKGLVSTGAGSNEPIKCHDTMTQTYDDLGTGHKPRGVKTN